MVGPVGPLETAAEWIGGLHRQLTRFEPGSELSRFNASAGRWVTVSPELGALLLAARGAFEESAGLVNAAILPALVAAGYDRTFEAMSAAPRSLGAPRDGHRIDADVPASVGRVPALPDVLEVHAGRARLAPGAAVDLGGLAKGWIADRAVERFGANSLANLGGDLRARGAGPAGDGWPVAFGGRTLLLRDMAAATSGTTKRRWGAGLHHLIDPRTGRPAASDLAEVSVLTDTALDAEVLAKTALLLGSERAPAYLEPRSKGWALA